jgi:signal transduction histidine kinase
MHFPALSDNPATVRHGVSVPGNPATLEDMEDFIYLISHDLRGSVRALVELPQWIAEDLEEAGTPLEGPAAMSVELMRRHTQRLDRMLKDLLTFSRIGRMQDIRDMDIEHVLDQVLCDLDLPPSIDVVRDLEWHSVRIGERDVHTLLKALVENAVKHHDRDDMEIRLTTYMAVDAMVLEVSDNGPGIPPAFQERVFGPMVTLRPRDEVEASGMGLAHVRKIATFCGGSTVVVPDADARGCTLRVTFPRCD